MSAIFGCTDVMTILARLLLLSAFLDTLAIPMACAQTLQKNMPADYLVQEVCIDQSGKMLPIDPYSCPQGDTSRPLEIGEPLPYHKHDQPGPNHPDGYQQHDSYPVRDLGGSLLIVNPFDYEPFDRFKSWRDGYDIYLVKDGWVSAGETKDGGGFSTTFFGANCRPYDGWVFFPASVFESPEPGRVEMPIHGNYWEQNGESWPGACPSSYQMHSLTTWDFVKGNSFGGVGGNPVKTLDTLRSVHGFSTNPQFLAHGHLEVFYFTRLYGVTRWEVWTPREQVDTDDKLRQRTADVATRCNNTDDINYEGEQFVVTACRDWSAVTVSKALATPISWPIPDMNLLRNFHFGDDFASWKHMDPTSGTISLSLKNSTAARDIKFVQAGGQGVRYTVLDCSGECSTGGMLYQDIPITAQTTSGTYTFGATTRFEGNGTGALKFSLSQLDSSGKVLSEKSFSANVTASNGHFTGADSVVLSSYFESTTVPVQIEPAAKFLRFGISPSTTGIFDIVDAWLLKETY